MCLKSFLSTEHFWQPVINVLSPFASTVVATHFFPSFPTVLAALKVQSCYSECRRNQITKSAPPAPFATSEPVLFPLLFCLCMRLVLLFMLFSCPVVLLFVLEVTAISSVCFQGFNCFLNVSSITNSIYIQFRVYMYKLPLLEIPRTLSYVACVDQATSI